jgi:hypothetical protein
MKIIKVSDFFKNCEFGQVENFYGENGKIFFVSDGKYTSCGDLPSEAFVDFFKHQLKKEIFYLDENTTF